MGATEYDPHDLGRFVEAQAADYGRALAEVRAGEKRTHWMWYVFPQLAGLGSSPAARHYGIAGRAEAAAYLAHPVLGPRLAECCAAAVGVSGRTADEVFGETDARKLRSCATLFAAVSPPGSVFARVLDCFFGGEPDPRTLDLLAEGGPEGAEPARGRRCAGDRELRIYASGGAVAVYGTGERVSPHWGEGAACRMLLTHTRLAAALQKLEGLIGWRDDLGRWVLLDETFGFRETLTEARAALTAAGYPNSTGV